MKRNRAAAQPSVVALGCAVLLALVMVPGCAAQRQWTKKGLTQAAFDQDAARCRKEAARATHQDPFAADAPHGLERTITQEKVFEQCMEAKGYRLEPGGSDK